MSTEITVVLAIAFVLLAVCTTLLMYHLWGYPFDKEKHLSSAPRWAMNLHRLMGWIFVAVYIYMMIQMVPRMWTYQVELPARTVLHLVLGYGIGGLLICKILIVRFFKHLEAALAPTLGTSILILTIVLMGLALPSVWREHVLSNQAINSEGFGEERLQRVAAQLPSTGLEDTKLIAELATTDSLIDGRKFLRSKCVQCHDLRTILARPRTAKSWHDTVKRMAGRAGVVNGFSEDEKWRIIAYLIAITPTLQNAMMQRSEVQRESTDTIDAMQKAGDMVAKSKPESFDLEKAEQVFTSKCSQCHTEQLPLMKSFASRDEVSQLVTRMIGHGLVASPEELEQIIRFLEDRNDLSSVEPSASQQAEPKAEVVQVKPKTELVAVAPAKMPNLANEKGCSGCHQIPMKVVGPAWLDVAKKYRGDKQARGKLIEKVKFGGSGNWNEQTGGIPMPANFPASSEEEITELVDFILALE